MRDEARAPRTVLVTVGDELLLGRTLDSNTAWLGAALAGLGMPVLASHTVGDDDAAIQEAVGRALGRADLVLVSGGLGPTEDDRTRDAVAALLDAPLRLDAELLRALEARFRARGYERLPGTNVRQAEVPRGARLLANPQGTAPGLALERRGRWVVLLPGVPREMRAIFEGDLLTLLREQFHARLRPVVHRTLHTTGIPESDLAERIQAALPENLGSVTLAYLPHTTGVDLRLSAWDASTQGEADEWLDPIERALAPTLRPFRYEGESGDIVEPVGRLLVASGRRLAVAESCTGGLVAKRLTDRSGASRYFAGGLVAYEDAVKQATLGVDPTVLALHGAVSEAVALQMALGVAEAFGTDTGLSVTGIAGPDGGSAEKPVGTVWYALSVDGVAVARRECFSGDRAQVRERAAQAALALLLRTLEGRS